MSVEVGWAEAQRGVRYDVLLTDWRVSARFTAVLLDFSVQSLQDDESIESGWDIKDARFDNGVIVGDCGGAALYVAEVSV